jgi:hypothetical protein
MTGRLLSGFALIGSFSSSTDQIHAPAWAGGLLLRSNWLSNLPFSFGAAGGKKGLQTST